MPEAHTIHPVVLEAQRIVDAEGRRLAMRTFTVIGALFGVALIIARRRHG